MKILVTGATGFVGRHVVQKLLDHGHSVVAVARNEALARSFPWYGDKRFISLDIYQPISDPIPKFDKPEVVIHLAWPGLPNYKGLFHFERNLPANYQFLKSLIDGGVGRLIIAGTCFEYGMQSGCLSENLPTLPANPYALAKDSLRKFLEALIADKPVVLQWARLFYMHGPGQNSKSLLSQLDQALIDRAKVFNMSGGEQLRDYLPVEEVASRIVSLIDHPECSGAVNICSGQPISVRRLVEQHLAKCNATILLNYGHYPYPDYEPMAFWGDDSKYQRYCGESKNVPLF
jgi:nucleoside-diphosphate-sugar epimerase